MRRRTFLMSMAGGLFTLVAGVGTWLTVAPPDLLKLGDSYAAKMVCSSLFVAGRNASEVLADDVQAPGHPLLRFIRVSVDEQRKTVTARMFGFAAPGHAIFRDGLGCSNVTDGAFAAFPGNRSLRRRSVEPDTTQPWPDGGALVADAGVQALIEDDQRAGPGLRGLVVIRDGRIIAERYGRGFYASTPLLGWSMTKTVTAALIGLRVRDGQMALDKADLLPQWRNDERSRITLSDLLGMQSGLGFNESYGSVTDATRMLFLENDMAAYAASKTLDTAPGTQFSYSSGTSVILSRLWMNSFASPREALTFPRASLFRPLGMSSAILEPDAHGTFVGSSYMYATARDWGRFALFLLQDGVWNNEPILPPDYVRLMRTATSASNGRFGSGQVWMKTGPEAQGFPSDAYWMRGHDGQSILLVPSMKLAVVRLGLTPRLMGYDDSVLHRDIIAALAKPQP
ncbi:serine hydrolase domain-containing protein [Rhizobium sp. 9140]|uniref:serine hydrolase domain-containing protein n=1 Tax=Rhizobium sp. 9140 TaxID=1761900 RepID=UPI0007976BCC|nr:serine hydrolase [Rhizobium sp. 9140]CZT35637.1 CubicO group peptidase, beta-lactamase class C family [Rhizobium sp. 9140]